MPRTTRRHAFDSPPKRSIVAALAVAAPALAACTGSSTALIVVVTSDLEPGVEIDRVVLTTCPGADPAQCEERTTFGLTPGAAGELSQSRTRGPYTFPFSFRLLPSAGDEAPTRIVLQGRLRDGTVSVRTFTTRFLRGQTVVVGASLPRACASLCPPVEGEPRAACSEGSPCPGETECPPLAGGAQCSAEIPLMPTVIPPDAGPDAEFSLVNPPDADAAPVDEGVDVTSEPAPDAPSQEAAIDAPFDAPPGDEAPDAPRDVPSDRPADAPSDAPSDAPRDAPMTCDSECGGLCPDYQTNPFHCSRCGVPCVVGRNARTECVAGRCATAEPTCVPGFLDCNRVASDGCEVDVRADPANCGACGRVCTTTAPGTVAVCVPGVLQGTCGAACAAGYTRTAAGACAAGVRPVSPPSGAVVTGTAPRFEWLAVDRGVVANIEFCQRAPGSDGTECLNRVTSPATAATSYTHTTVFPQGAWFWRVNVATTPATTPVHTSPWMEFFSTGLSATSMPRTSGVSNIRLDLDADGATDLASGELYSTPTLDASTEFQGEQFNRVNVYLGRVGATTPSLLSPSAVLRAGREHSYFGSIVHPAGDVNGDGYGDLVVSALQSVLLFAGGPSGPATAPTAWVPIMSVAHDAVFDVTPAGDLNRDGFADVAVLNAEGVTVLLGGPDGLSRRADRTVTMAQEAGASFAHIVGGFDANGDGNGDLAATSTYDGRVFCWLSTSSRTVAGARPMPVELSRPGVLAGEAAEVPGSLAAADVNNDGFADLIVGAPAVCTGMTSGSDCVRLGRVTVTYGGPTGSTFSRTVALPRVGGAPSGRPFYGIFIATGTDLNADGLLDIAISDSGTSELHFYGGAPGTAAPVPLHVLPEPSQDNFPNVVALPHSFEGASRRPMVIASSRLDSHDGRLWYRTASTLRELTPVARALTPPSPAVIISRPYLGASWAY